MPDVPRVVLLTGSAQGIGRATACALGARGFRLALVDRAGGPLRDLVDELKRDGIVAAGETADVRDRDGLLAAVAGLERSVGPVGVLVACAGVGTLASVTDLDTPGLRAMLEVNVLGVAHAIEAALPGMIARGSGHIVGIASVAGYRGLPWMPGYSASKAALATYLEGLRPALKVRGIAVTTVYPGFVRTGLTVATPFRRPVPMLEPEEAARQIAQAVERRPRDHVFPRGTAWQMGMLRRMPGGVFDWMMGKAGPRALDENQYQY
jgi:short-subunit dehydrogenase